MSDLAEGDAISACPVCEHRVKWHHDERGCDYHGAGPHRCPCRRTSEQVVALVISRAMSRIADQWFDAIVTGNPPTFAPGQPTPPTAEADTSAGGL